MIETIKEMLTTFLTSSFVTKVLIFISTFFAPAKELYILLIALVIFDWIIDIGVWVWSYKKRQEKTIWEVTKTSITKLIFYSILMLSVNAVQLYLIKDLSDMYKIIMSIPILAELLSITQTVEKHTGISVSETVKSIFGKLQNKD